MGVACTAAAAATVAGPPPRGHTSSTLGNVPCQNTLPVMRHSHLQSVPQACDMVPSYLTSSLCNNATAAHLPCPALSPCRPGLLQPGVSLFGAYEFGKPEMCVLRAAVVEDLQLEGCSTQREAAAWGKALTFHHQWMVLCREHAAALVHHMHDVIRVRGSTVLAARCAAHMCKPYWCDQSTKHTHCAACCDGHPVCVVCAKNPMIRLSPCIWPMS